MIYYIVYGLCLIGAVLAFFPKFENHRDKILWGLGGVLILLAGLRYHTGFDFESYITIFYQTPKLPNLFSEWRAVNVEWGYLFLNSIVRTLGLPVNAVLFVMAAATISILVIAFKRISTYPILVLLLYVSRFFFVRDMGQIRASIASALILFSIPYIQEKKLIKFLATIFVAFLFHQVAVVGLIIYLINLIFKKGVPTKLIIGSIALSFVIGFVNLQNVILSLEGFIPERYIQYVTHEFYVFSLGLTNPVLLMQVMILTAMLIFRKQIKNKYFNVLLIGYTFSTVILASLNQFGTLAGRLSTTFASFEVLIIPLFVDVFKNGIPIFVKKEWPLKLQANFHKLIYGLVIAYAIGIFTLVFVTDVKPYFVPYHWVFIGELPVIPEEVVPIFKKGVVRSTFNIRTEPTVEAEIIQVVARGVHLEIIGELREWWKITLGTTEGFIHKQGVYAFIADGIMIADANFRKEGNSEAEILTILREGTTFQIIERNNGWYHVFLEGESGWINEFAVQVVEQDSN